MVVRLAVGAVLVAAPAVPLAAQSAMPPRAIMLIDWERQKKNVLAYIDVMPDSAITFAPTAGVRISRPRRRGAGSICRRSTRCGRSASSFHTCG
jgi:hypothetical protein